MSIGAVSEVTLGESETVVARSFSWHWEKGLSVTARLPGIPSQYSGDPSHKAHENLRRDNPGRDPTNLVVRIVWVEVWGLGVVDDAQEQPQGIGGQEYELRRHSEARSRQRKDDGCIDASVAGAKLVSSSGPRGLELTDGEDKDPGEDHEGNVGVDDTDMIGVGKVSVWVFRGVFGLVGGMAHVHVAHVVSLVAMRQDDWEKREEDCARRVR